MTPARFMEEISRWMDENVMAQVGVQKKGRFQIALESALNHLCEIVI